MGKFAERLKELRKSKRPPRNGGRSDIGMSTEVTSMKKKCYDNLPLREYYKPAQEDFLHVYIIKTTALCAVEKMIVSLKI